MKISELIDKKIAEDHFDDFPYDLQDKLILPDGRPKVIPIGGGLKAVYHRQSNSFRYWEGDNKGQPVSGLALRRVWNNLGVGIGGTTSGKEKLQKRDPYSRAKAWLSGEGPEDTARQTRLDPTASKMKKLAVGAYMKMFGPKGMPGKIPLSDKTKEMLQGYVNKGEQKKMATAFQNAIDIGQQVGIKGKIGDGGGGTLRNIEKNKEAMASAAAKYNELINKMPGMAPLLTHLANSGEFVPALHWVKTAKPMTTNLLPHQAKGLPKPQGKLPAPKKPLALPKPQGKLPAPKGTRRNPKSGRFDPGNQSGVQFASTPEK